jgi:hypothetical protein
MGLPGFARNHKEEAVRWLRDYSAAKSPELRVRIPTAAQHFSRNGRLQ